MRNDASAVKQEFLVLKRVPELVTSVACGRAMQERGRLVVRVCWRLSCPGTGNCPGARERIEDSLCDWIRHFSEQGESWRRTFYWTWENGVDNRRISHVGPTLSHAPHTRARSARSSHCFCPIKLVMPRHTTPVRWESLLCVRYVVRI